MPEPILPLPGGDSRPPKIKEALGRIKTARQQQSAELDLSRLDLTRLPESLGKLTSLRKLDLSHNQLTRVPESLWNLVTLRTLNLSRNQLNTLSESLGNLTKLQMLLLYDNQLTRVPDSLWNLPALRTLDLAGNQLATVPESLGNLAGLQNLFLHNNQLKTLPESLGDLTTLQMLDLGGNQLATVPESLRKLTTLRTLFLSDNQFAALPEWLGTLTQLKGIYLHENPALGIPASILGPTWVEVYGVEKKSAAHASDILNFYFAQRQGAAAGTLRPVNEIKVMLVGRGGAGKTSLRRFFMGKPHDKQEPETPGIALDSFALRCKQRELTVRLWDFAGQEITHALHQFFLTEGCVYVLVLDPRSNTEMQDAEYWLGLLKRYAGGAPVLVALNRQDARQGGYDVDRRALLERFPFIQSFTATNCEKRVNCTELQQKLCDAVELLKHTEPPHLKVPESWLQVMRECDGEGRGKRQHLTLHEFRQICARHGETESAKQEWLARLLHKLGAVLHFVDEPRLRDTTVLNPHWVTDGVYRLLRYKDRASSDGTLTLAEALMALPGEKETAARFLLRLMERFEMCFPLDEDESGKPTTRWLIPGALGEFQPEGVTADWQKQGSVRLRYVYQPLPEGVLPRFIVMTHMLSEGKPCWRNGVILEDGQAAALVRRGENRNHVEVTAFGPEAERLRLLEIIQGNFERIHTDLPDPKPVAEMEISGLPGTFRPMADLEAAEKQEVMVAVKTPTTEAKVDPTPQLNKISERAARVEGRVPLNAFLSYSHKDKKVKTIFKDNLTVLAKKNFVTPWHDGLIEPGMRWLEEIEENLAKMDVFVGLLTTAFLASDFIEKVEIKAARQKLRDQGKEFHFVLILVDDISLHGLDLAEYQILKPGGKAVCDHRSCKEGFNQAQKELELLLLKWQAKKKQEQKRDEPSFRQPVTKAQENEGITIIVQGDYIAGKKAMTNDHSIHIGGNVMNAQVGQTLTNCTNMIQQQSPGERKALLEELARQVQCLIKELPPEKQDKAHKIARDLKVVVEQSTSNEPEREWYALSAKGVLEAATWVKDMSTQLAGTIKSLGKSLWPDFLLPGDKE